MADLSEFTRPLGWKLKQGKPPATYPDGHILMITLSKGSSPNRPLVDLTWINSQMMSEQLLGIPFDVKKGSINGQTSDGKFTVTVTLTVGNPPQLVGDVRTVISPEPGTWGADANGGWEEKP